MKIDVSHVAKLADLPLTKEEEDSPRGEAGKYSEQLSKILDYVEQLNKVDISNVESTFNVTGQSNVMREDKTISSLSQEEALSNAPKKLNGMFETKGVFDE